MLWYADVMNTMLKTVLDEVERLPDVDQQELAGKIEDMVIQHKIALAEADIVAGRVRPAEDVFSDLKKRYGG